MKKVASVLFVCFFAVFCFSACGKEQIKTEYGGIVWECRVSGGTVSVKPAFEEVGEDLRKYESKIKSEVYVPASIGGKTVTKIEDYAFSHCLEIEKVVIGEGVTKIGKYAFSGCKNLKEIILPDSLKYIDTQALCGTSVESIVLSENFRSFSEKNGEPFFNCTSLTQIIVAPKNHIYASQNGVLFSNDMKTLICYPSNKGGKTYTVPDTVTEIKRGAFSQTQKLEALKLPQSVKTVSADFYRCSIKEIAVKEKLFSALSENEKFKGIKITVY